MKNGADNFTAERVAELRKNIDFSDIPEIKDFSGGYDKTKKEMEGIQTGITILPTAQFKRMDWNEDKLWSLIKRLKNDERTKDLFSFSEDKFGRFDFTFNG